MRISGTMAFTSDRLPGLCEWEVTTLRNQAHTTRKIEPWANVRAVRHPPGTPRIGVPAAKELNARILLQRLDLETHSGLREIQFFGGLAGAELFRNCPEDHETKIFESRHSMNRTPALGSRCEYRSRAGQNRRGMSAIGRGRFSYSQLNLDLRRLQERVVNQAVMHGAHESLRLFLRQRDGAHNMNAKVSNSGRLFQLVCGHCDLHACLPEIAGLQILHGVEGRARSQRPEQQFRRRHAGVFAAIFFSQSQ